VIIKISHDRLDQVRDAFERAAPDAFVGDFPKPAFDHVEPRAGSRDKVQMESRMTLEPSQDRWMLVSSVVVDDKVQIQIHWGFDVDKLQKSDEFLVPVPRHTIADHLTVEHIESRE
jgi:hypothetical protein